MDALLLDKFNIPRACRYGERAVRLAQLNTLGIRFPRTVALSIGAVTSLVSEKDANLEPILKHFPEPSLLAVRSSPRYTGCGGVNAFLYVGLNDQLHLRLRRRVGQYAAERMYVHHIGSYASRTRNVEVGPPAQHRGDCDGQLGFGPVELLGDYEAIVGCEFPQCRSDQLHAVICTMAREWNNRSARLLRAARGYSEDVGLGLIIQTLVVNGKCDGPRTWTSHAVDPRTGKSDFQLSACTRPGQADFAADSEQTLELEQQVSAVHDKLRVGLADEFQLQSVDDGKTLYVLDYAPVDRNVAARIRIAVNLVERRAIDKAEALTRIDPEHLSTLLHPQVSQHATNAVVARGIAASPGAATGVIVFSSAAAEAQAAQARHCILVRAETGPEDIRGMHIAQGVLTGRGGMTSHAAVIARGLGVPCVAGALDIDFWPQSGALITRGGCIFREGDTITIDGTAGVVLEGAAKTLPPDYGRFFKTYLSWADQYRDLGIRANADTLDEVRVALQFGAEGVGLCRTEHMFFAESRLTAMREMIFAATPDERRQSLGKLLPIQRSDFLELFQSLPGKPVCIRLLDPPLHEFLPRDHEEMTELAEALGLSLDQLTARAEELKEFNPMLGMRGVRLGIAVPEIYEMQARAIFEAAAKATSQGISVSPEIMIPLVSANREVQLVKEQLDQVASEVWKSTGNRFEYQLGVMVETPRAAMRAGELAVNATFLSFGTNDLTQLTYGISRDDSSRIIDEYIRRGVYPGDPFSRIDRKGVGELMELAVERGIATRPDLVLSLCGEHAASADTIEFCRNAEFSYISCSPFRVPIARLAAAQAVIRQAFQADGSAPEARS